MLEFRSIRVPNQFYSYWTRVHLTTERILISNPTIINYWVYIWRDSFYRRLSHLKLNNVEDVRRKVLTKNDDVSVADVHQIYQFIRTSIHIAVNNDTCSSSYYAQTKQNDNEDKTTTIWLSNRLLQSNSDAFVFVAAAVLLREISRAIWPECLKNTRSTRFLQNPLFYSWSGIPEKLWPNTRKDGEEIWKRYRMIYITCPANSERKFVADTGNLFQHLFYNGEVHLYDDEIDDRDGQIMVHVALRVHQTLSSLCAARYLHDKILHDFFNINQYSLEVIRSINDQTCPYLKYLPAEETFNTIDDIVIDDRPRAERTYKDDSFNCNYDGLFYEFKPYKPKEPQQHYEQSVFIGYAHYIHVSKCVRLFEHVIRSDDTFFLENRWLFRRKRPVPPIVWSSTIEKPCSTSSQIEPKRININAWDRCITRLKAFYENLILKISIATNRKHT